MKVSATKKPTTTQCKPCSHCKAFLLLVNTTAWYTAELGAAWPSGDIVPATSQWLKKAPTSRQDQTALLLLEPSAPARGSAGVQAATVVWMKLKLTKPFFCLFPWQNSIQKWQFFLSLKIFANGHSWFGFPASLVLSHTGPKEHSIFIPNANHAAFKAETWQCDSTEMSPVFN